jgi:hypothetical protein
MRFNMAEAAGILLFPVRQRAAPGGRKRKRLAMMRQRRF